jgi:hypothetical protein
MRILLLTLLLIGFAFSAVNKPAGSVKSVDAVDFFRHPQTGKNYNESWDYVFILDNGAKAYVTYTWLNSSNEIGTQFSIWNFLGKSANIGRIYPKERYREDKNANLISIKDEYKMEKLPGTGHRVLFTANKDGKYFLDLKFTTTQPGQVPGNGIFEVNGQKYGLYVHIPYGRVEGRIGINGDTIAVKGYGYMDHSWTTEEATKLISRSFVFCSTTLEKSASKIAGRVNINPNGEVFGYATSIANGGSAELVMPIQILDNGSAYNQKKFPSNVEIIWNKEEFSPLSFAVAYQEKYALLASMGIPKIAISAKGGDIFYLRGRSKTNHWGRIDWVISGK